MTEAGTVLVGVDGSDVSRHALDWAYHLGAKSGLQVRAVMAWHYPAPQIGESEQAPETADLVRSHLSEIVSAVGVPDVELQVVEGLPTVALVEAASSPDIRMLVIGRRGLGSIPDLLLGSVARSLLHTPPCPVVLVPRQPAGGWPDFSKVVAAIDGSDLSGDVVEFICRLGRNMAITPTVLHCIDIGAEFSSDLLQEVVDRTRSTVIERWCGELDGRSTPFTVDVRNTEARRGIVEATQEFEAGLVAVGLHGAGQFRGIGGTTSYLARHLEAPLVVVPPSGSPGHDLGYRL